MSGKYELVFAGRNDEDFFNTTGTKGNLNKQAVNVLKFIEDNTIEDDFTKRLAQEVQKIKENKEWKVEYMTLLMREREKYQEGMAGKVEELETKGSAQKSLGLKL